MNYILPEYILIFNSFFFGVGGDYCVWVCWYSSIGKFGCLLASGYVDMRNAILLDLVPHTLEYLPIHFRFSKSKQYTLFTIYCNKSWLGVTIWYDLLVSFYFDFLFVCCSFFNFELVCLVFIPDVLIWYLSTCQRQLAFATIITFAPNKTQLSVYVMADPIVSASVGTSATEGPPHPSEISFGTMCT